MTYLEFLNWCDDEGRRLPSEGLCSCAKLFTDIEIFELFTPTHDDKTVLYKENKSCSYWGDGINNFDASVSRVRVLTQLRIDILLFCAAINGEL